MRHSRRAIAALTLLALGILAGCGAGDANAPDCDAIAAALVSRVDVVPDVASLNVGDSLQLRAVAYSCAGPLTVGGGFQWRSGDASVATASAGGLVTAMTNGTVSIFAAAQGKEGSSSLTTHARPVARVTVEPASATLGAGRTSQLTARAFDAQNHEIIGRAVTWSSANAGIVAVDAQGNITGGTVGGPVAVKATIDGKFASAQVTVVQVAVNSVTVAPTPSTIAAGNTVQLTATLRDELNNVLTGRAVNWESSDPTLASVTGAGGLVTGLKPGTVTITAASEGKSGTAQVTVTLGAAAKLHYIQQPGTAEAGSAITPAPTVAIEDAAGNRITTANSAVTVALAAPNGATLGGTLTVNAVGGLATFSNVTVSTAGTYALTATSAGLTDATSSSFLVTPIPPTQLTFGQQPPASVRSGEAISPAVTVQLRDANGTEVSQGGISVALGMSGGGTLANATAITNPSGLATFVGLTATAADGEGYTLTASSSGLSSATSDAFAITSPPPTKLGFLTQPASNTRAGIPFIPPVAVQVRDADGLPVLTSTATITLSLSGAPAGTTLTGNVATAVAGVALFVDLVVSRSGRDFTLVATSPGLASATSMKFRIR